MAICKATTDTIGFPDLHLEVIDAEPALCLDNVEADVQPVLQRYACILVKGPVGPIVFVTTVMGEYPLGGT